MHFRNNKIENRQSVLIHKDISIFHSIERDWLIWKILTFLWLI